MFTFAGIIQLVVSLIHMSMIIGARCEIEAQSFHVCMHI